MGLRDREWWPAADAVARLGHAVTVLDPELDQDVELLWDQNPEHGVVTVISTPTLTGWQLLTAEEIRQLDEATIRALDALADRRTNQTHEDDGAPD